jgi:hypothetical protein
MTKAPLVMLNELFRKINHGMFDVALFNFMVIKNNYQV